MAEGMTQWFDTAPLAALLAAAGNAGTAKQSASLNSRAAVATYCFPHLPLNLEEGWAVI